MANFVDAAYAVDEETRGFVRVIIGVKGLQVKREGGFFSKKNSAKNANIPDPNFGPRSVSVYITGKDSKCKQNLQFVIQRLPYDIVGESSYIEPEEGRVLVFLKKADSGQSWSSCLGSLETAD